MPSDEIMQYVATTGTGAVGGAGVLFMLIKMFMGVVKPEDLANLKAEIFEKFITKEAMQAMVQPLIDDLHYIRQRIDAIKPPQI